MTVCIYKTLELVLWPESATDWFLVLRKSPPECWSVTVIPLLQCVALPSPCVLRKGSRVFSLCLSNRKWNGLDGQAQCLDTDVAEAGLGPETIVLCLETTGGYFCFCCLILSDIVSKSSRGRCVYVSLLVHSTISVVHSSPKPWSKGNRRPLISIEIVRQVPSCCDKDCLLCGSWRCTEPDEDKHI